MPKILGRSNFRCRIVHVQREVADCFGCDLRESIRDNSFDDLYAWNGTECFGDFVITATVASRQNPHPTLIFRNQMLDQTLIGIKQPKPLIELVEFNVTHHRPRQAASIDAALDEIPLLVADAPSRPTANIGSPLDVLSSPRAGRFSELVGVAEI